MLDLNQRKRLASVISDVHEEVEKAMAKFSPMKSPHEGYAVILEELDELWEEVKLNRGKEGSAYLEAKQVAAMAIRYMLEVAR